MSSPAPEPAPENLSGLSALKGRYDALLCDIWGVIHNGLEPFGPACEALVRFQEDLGPVVLISNSPRPCADVIAQMRQIGVPDRAWSGIVTSGDVTRSLLAARSPGAAWAIGPDRDRSLYHGLDLNFAPPDAADFISCTGPVDDEVETPEDYRPALARAAARDLEMICANPDRMVQRGDRLIYCGGALAALYQELGGRVIMAGKPFAPIYERALETAAERVSGPLLKDRVLTVGDGRLTDLLGANRQGLDCVFVAGGVHAADSIDHRGALNREGLGASLAKDGVYAAYALAALVW
jgi:HAD superfamily hydrolase (TIGR01459 family)